MPASTPPEPPRPIRLNDRLFLLVGIPVMALLALLPRGLLSITSAWQVVVAWLISLVFTTVFWVLGRTLWLQLFRRFPSMSQTHKRLWLLGLGSLVITMGATAVLLITTNKLMGGSGELPFPDLLREFGLNLIPTVIVQLVYESSNYFRQWAENVRRAEQLQSAGVQSQLEALQSQLDPHFLFNNLNTLSALIEPENEPAQQFVEQLSDVYRYVLLTRDKTTVSLAEELAFVDTFLALHKARFRDNLRVVRAVPTAALPLRVAPLSVQLLVENALKHNVASQQHPLELRLTADLAGGYVAVENTLRPRTAGLAPGTGTGLRNVRHRYHLLQAPQPVEVSEGNGWFRVQLPLLPPS
ncbi:MULTISPECIES: sensor histidine kinase [Hymenobacter]|uniref:Histidine kinase n=1 Tax=Hymenobacter mucosus TaxID=1411120 RepID=A0A238XYB0_9BACT|nr:MULTISPECIES: histidine kinase [Hymenobacter]SNR63334.1 Histidine kinase [Hymenobacter mucosus]